MKQLTMRVLDQNVLDSNKTEVKVQGLENYFGRRDLEAYGVVEVFVSSQRSKLVYLARKKYVPRVTKGLIAKGINEPVVMSREEANKTFARAMGVRFDVSEIKED